MIDYTNKDYLEAISKAVESCTLPYEEEGGIILEKDGSFLYVRVKNIHENTPTASGLYETDAGELTDKVISKVQTGWKFHSSFHTHPTFSPTPSGIDRHELFKSFKFNVIYSPKQDLFSFNEWIENKLITIYISSSTIKTILQYL
jgi:hypothetical protein